MSIRAGKPRSVTYLSVPALAFRQILLIFFSNRASANITPFARRPESGGTQREGLSLLPLHEEGRHG